MHNALSARNLVAVSIGALLLACGAASPESESTSAAPAGSEPRITAVASANDFSIVAAPSAVTVAAGASASVGVQTLITSGAPQTIALTVAGLPSGVTGSFQPASVNGGGSSVLTLTASANAAPGTSTITVAGIEGNTSRSTSVNVTVVTGGVNGGCPAGWHDIGGICVPGGCSVSVSVDAGSATVVGIAGVGLLTILRRRRKPSR